MRKKVWALLVLAASLIALVVILSGSASARPTKYAVCHYGDATDPSPPKTLWLGSPNAVAKHVANHTVVNGHSGDDYAGPCV